MHVRFATIVVAFGLVCLVGPAGAQAKSVTRTLNGDSYVVVANLNNHSFEQPGPYAVGEYSVQIRVTDTSGKKFGTTVEIWYPAVNGPGVRSSYNLAQWVPSPLQVLLQTTSARTLVARAGYIENARNSLAVAPGVFPLVLFSHGYAGVRDQSSYLTTSLASWGFVVAAPDHVNRDFTATINNVLGVAPASTDPNVDVNELVATVLSINEGVAGPVTGHVDTNHVVAVGHSAGAGTVMKLASFMQFSQPTTSWLSGWVALAGANFGPVGSSPYKLPLSSPGLFIAADHDHIVPLFALKPEYNALGSQRRFVEIRGTGHQIFGDACAINHGHGGAVAIAEALGAPLSITQAKQSDDGCFGAHGTRVLFEARWKVIDQLVVAGVRYDLGFDHSSAGSDGLASTDPTVVALDTTGSI